MHCLSRISQRILLWISRMHPSVLSIDHWPRFLSSQLFNQKLREIFSGPYSSSVLSEKLGLWFAFYVSFFYQYFMSVFRESSSSNFFLFLLKKVNPNNFFNITTNLINNPRMYHNVDYDYQLFLLNQIEIVLILIQTSLNYAFLQNLSSQSNTIVQTKF